MRCEVYTVYKEVYFMLLRFLGVSILLRDIMLEKGYAVHTTQC